MQSFFGKECIPYQNFLTFNVRRQAQRGQICKKGGVPFFKCWRIIKKETSPGNEELTKVHQ